MRLILVQGDITEQDVDAVVNAANSSLLGGGGVDGLPTGQAVATTAGHLPARWVIHTVGPVYSAHEEPGPLLASCHTEALRVADEVGATSVAFPAISTGVYGYPLNEAAPVAVGAVRSTRSNVEEVRFVLFDRGAYDAFAAAL